MAGLRRHGHYEPRLPCDAIQIGRFRRILDEDGLEHLLKANIDCAAGGAGFAIDPLQLAAGRDLAAEALAWARPQLGDAPLLVYATAEPAAVRAVQQQLGVEQAGALVEQALSRSAVGLVHAGVGQRIVAGGETSGACVQALGIRHLRIGAQIDPGVPWCHAATAARPAGLHLALKSGNFGATDFFHRAFELL